MIENILAGVDQSIFFFFQQLQRPWLDIFFAWPTYLGSTAITLILLGAILISQDPQKSLFKVPAVILTAFLTYQAVDFLKAFFARPRPFLYWENVHVIFEKPTNHAMPSGHAATIFAAAYLLNHFYPSKMRWTYAIAVWVSLTRVYVGVHYPTDLPAGALLGISCAAFCCFLFKPLERLGNASKTS